jgi:hypothetical protein
MDDYNIEFDILTKAIAEMGARGITRQEVLPILVDFTAAAALALAGEGVIEAIEACITRLRERIKDFRTGTFPVAKGELT